VLLSDEEQKKKHTHLQEEITCFFSSIGWLLSFLGRLSTNRVGRIRKKKQASKQITMKYGEE